MDFSQLASTVVYLVTVVTSVEAYSTGAPQSACSTMTPSHGAGAQTSSSPYGVYIPNLSIISGDDITVTISSPKGSTFEGFLIKAIDTSNNNLVGFFTNHPGGTRGVMCGLSFSGDGAVTHSNSNRKTTVSFTWTSPSSGVPRVRFRATIVQTKTVFWKDVDSPLISLQPPTTIPPVTTSASTAAPPTLSTPATTTTSPVTTSTQNQAATTGTTNAAPMWTSCSKMLFISFMLVLAF